MRSAEPSARAVELGRTSCMEAERALRVAEGRVSNADHLRELIRTAAEPADLVHGGKLDGKTVRAVSWQRPATPT